MKGFLSTLFGEDMRWDNIKKGRGEIAEGGSQKMERRTAKEENRRQKEESGNRRKCRRQHTKNWLKITERKGAIEEDRKQTTLIKNRNEKLDDHER